MSESGVEGAARGIGTYNKHMHMFKYITINVRENWEKTIRRLIDRKKEKRDIEKTIKQ